MFMEGALNLKKWEREIETGLVLLSWGEFVAAAIDRWSLLFGKFGAIDGAIVSGNAAFLVFLLPRRPRGCFTQMQTLINDRIN